jgi:hypothetical protein
MRVFFVLALLFIGSLYAGGKPEKTLVIEGIRKLFKAYDFSPLITEDGEVRFLGYLFWNEGPADFFYPFVEIEQGEERIYAAIALHLDPESKELECMPLFFTHNYQPISVELWQELSKEIHSQLSDQGGGFLPVIKDVRMPPFLSGMEAVQNFLNGAKPRVQVWTSLQGNFQDTFYVILRPESNDFLIIKAETESDALWKE